MTEILRYIYGGLIIQSTAALPLIRCRPSDAAVDIEVTFGPLPPPLAACVRAKPHFQMYADGTSVLRSPEGIRLLFDRGRRLQLEVPEGVDPKLLQSWLVGPGLGLILHQRATPPLHASAVTLAGRAIAIGGDSGAGKSTTSRALLQRGHRLLAEDQAMIDPMARHVYPGAPDLRLWAAAACHFGDPTPADARVGTGEDKFTITSLRERFDDEPRSLAAVFILSPDPADRPTADRLGKAVAATALHRHVYRLRLATFMGLGPGIFRWATTLAATVPVFTLRRPHDLARLDELATAIEQVMESLG